MQQFFKLTTKQCIDAGLAAILILTLVGYFSENVIYFHIIIPVVILLMIAPRIFYPFGVLWFGLAHLLGNVVSRIILSAIYVVFVVPVGLIRQAMGKDSLQLRRFGKDKASVFQNREHNYISKDLETPY
ncbi:MAG: hypothetical protein K9I68_06925 [Bacteroidales bacterium]|nr:hypothetical protein [Bacteroidales bacterium]MCF8338295.1 hypothetical protein [Bacteroidales bacterium]